MVTTNTFIKTCHYKHYLKCTQIEIINMENAYYSSTYTLVLYMYTLVKCTIVETGSVYPGQLGQICQGGPLYKMMWHCKMNLLV